MEEREKEKSAQLLHCSSSCLFDLFIVVDVATKIAKESIIKEKLEITI